MPNNKRITLDWSETAKTVYCIVRREADNFRLNDADGTFALNPADPYLSLLEDSVIKGRYEISESRTAWNGGRYTIAVYKQTGTSPVPASDTIIGTGEMDIINDAEIYSDVLPSSRAAQTSVDGKPTLSQIEGSTILAKQAKIDFVEKWILNKLAESPDNTWKLYDDDGVTVLKTWIWDSAVRMRSKAV